MEARKAFERRLEQRFCATRRGVLFRCAAHTKTDSGSTHWSPPTARPNPPAPHCTRSLSHAQRGRPAATPGLHLQTRTFKQLAGSLSDPLNDFTLDIWNVDFPFPSPLYVVAGRKYPTRPLLRRLLFSGVRRSILRCGRISERPSVSSDAAPATSHESPSLPLPFRV